MLSYFTRFIHLLAEGVVRRESYVQSQLLNEVSCGTPLFYFTIRINDFAADIIDGFTDCGFCL